MIRARYADAGARPQALMTGNLHLYNVNRSGVANEGDPVNLTTTCTLIPAQVTTGPWDRPLV